MVYKKSNIKITRLALVRKGLKGSMTWGKSNVLHEQVTCVQKQFLRKGSHLILWQIDRNVLVLFGDRSFFRFSISS